MRTLHTVLALTALALTTPAQDGSLVYSVRGPGHHSTISGTPGSALNQITSEDLAVFTPSVTASAATYLNRAAFNAMHGDKNCDASYVQPVLGAGIDALMICDEGGALHFGDHFFSVRSTVGILGLTDTMTPGDIASPSLGGGYTYLIREEQIRSVFDIPAEFPVNVDAVAKAPDGTLFLSLEENVMMLGGLVANDGALLMIQGADLLYEGCTVADTFPGTGVLLADEFVFDAYTANSGVSDVMGDAISTIGDLDGLEIDPQGGTWIAQVEGQIYEIPNLLYVGQRLVGGSVLTTRNGGQLARINGRLMGSLSPASTDGTRIGLEPGTHGVVQALNALALNPAMEPLRVLTEVAPEEAVSGGPVEVEWAGADAHSPVIIKLTADFSSACGGVPGVLNPKLGFGVWFNGASVDFTSLLPTNSNGDGKLMGTLPLGVSSGLWVCLQTLTRKSGALVIGGPAIAQF